MGKFSSPSRPSPPPPPPAPVKKAPKRVAISEVKRQQSSLKEGRGGSGASSSIFTQGTQGIGDSSLSTGKTLLGG